MTASKHKESHHWAEVVLSACRDLLGVSGGCVFVLDDEGNEVEVAALPAPDATAGSRSFLPEPARRVKESARESGRVVYRNDVSGTGPANGPPEAATAVHNVLFAPLKAEDKIAGLLGLFGKPGGFGDDDVRAASLLGKIASMALENRRVVDELRESEAKYRIIVDNTRDWEWWLAPDHRFIHMSPSCKEFTGRDPEEFLSDPDLIMNIVHPEDRSAFFKHRNEVDRTLAGGQAEFRVVRADGTYRWVAHVCQPVFDEEARFIGHLGSNRDVTERKRAEEALRRSEETLRALSSELINVQENERRRIARELHDGVNQTLTAIKFALETKVGQMSKRGALRGISLEKIISMVQHGIEETRRIQMALRPSVLDDLGILATLSWFSREFESVYSHIRIERSIGTAEEEIPPALKTAIFRIVQEALNNVAKHSGADVVRIGLNNRAGGLELIIEDNGRGFDPGKVEGGFGLISMKERAEMSGGSLAVDSGPGRGAALRAFWQLKGS